MLNIALVSLKNLKYLAAPPSSTLRHLCTQFENHRSQVALASFKGGKRPILSPS